MIRILAIDDDRQYHILNPSDDPGYHKLDYFNAREYHSSTLCVDLAGHIRQKRSDEYLGLYECHSFNQGVNYPKLKYRSAI